MKKRVRCKACDGLFSLKKKANGEYRKIQYLCPGCSYLGKNEINKLRYSKDSVYIGGDVKTKIKKVHDAIVQLENNIDVADKVVSPEKDIAGISRITDIPVDEVKQFLAYERIDMAKANKEYKLPWKYVVDNKLTTCDSPALQSLLSDERIIIILRIIKSVLTTEEFLIMASIYMLDISITELSEITKTDIKDIRKIKVNALRKLRVPLIHDILSDVSDTWTIQ